MLRVVQEWKRDFRHAARALARVPGFTAMSVLTLGLAIGACAGMFGVVDTVLLRPLPYAHVDRLINITAAAPGSDFPPEFGVSNEFYLQYKEQSKLLEGVSTYNSFTSTFRTDDRVERIRMSWPTTSLFTTLGASPIHGRLPVAEDEDRVVVISYELWQSWFGKDLSVIGKTYDVSGSKRTIVGIMGPEFQFPSDGTLLWISNNIRAAGLVPGRFGGPLVARMAPGATVEAVTAELTGLSKGLPARFGGSANYARLIGQHRAVVRSLSDEILGEVSRSLWLLLAATGIVLLIACANVANLFMVRAEGRLRDLAVRRAIGATRAQLIRLQLAEATIVAALAGVVAATLATISLPMFVRLAPPGIPRLAAAGFNLPTFSFTVAAAVLAALACGMAPALRASAPDLTRLREGGRSSTRGQQWTRDALVAAQTALALVLLIASGLLLRSFQELRRVDPGYDTTDIFTFQIAPERESLRDGPSFARFQLDFMDRLRALPGVTSVGLVENIPLNEDTATGRFQPEENANDREGGSLMRFTFAAGDYFKTMNIAVVEGRTFESADHISSLGNVIISRTAANLLWPAKSAVGRKLQRQGQNSWDTVIGVVEDVMQNDFRHAPNPLVYFPLVGPTPGSWAISSPAYVVKTPRAETIAPEIRALVHEVAPEAPMYRVFTMAGLARDSMVALSFTMLLLGIAALLAIILSGVGLYATLSYVVAGRTREIGVRMALGADVGQVRRMFVVRGGRVIGVGIAVGLIGAVASTRALSSLLFNVTALDGSTFAAMVGSMIIVGLLASYIPARRASNVTPVESLKVD